MIPVSLILLGLSIKHLIGRRRFKRTNAAGVQQFRSYEEKVAATSLEWIGSLIARLLIIIGILMLIVSR